MIGRRWTAVQAPNGIVTTIRFRDPAIRVPYQLAAAFPVQARQITVTGRSPKQTWGTCSPHVQGADRWPPWTVHLWWWKFATPVRDGETVTVHGSRLNLPGEPVIRVSSFTDHWLKIGN